MALVRASLVGWDGVTGEAGTPIPYSEAERDRLLAMPFVLLAVAEAIRQAADRTRARAAALNRALAAEPAPEVH